MARTDNRDGLIHELMRVYGRTYAQDAGIRLADRPEPLYQLLVLASLLGKRITAEVALATARELFAAGLRNPQSMVDASWQERVDILGRGHYRRYDESTARLLGEAARHCLDRWGGDLRRLRREAAGDGGRLSALLQEFAGIGPTGAAIFTREVQGVWPEFRPAIDAKVADGARALHLEPSSIEHLAPERDLPRLTSALVRAGLARRLPDELRPHVR